MRTGDTYGNGYNWNDLNGQQQIFDLSYPMFGESLKTVYERETMSHFINVIRLRLRVTRVSRKTPMSRSIRDANLMGDVQQPDYYPGRDRLLPDNLLDVPQTTLITNYLTQQEHTRELTTKPRTTLDTT